MELNLKLLLAMFCADVDIFLLQNEAQTADNEKEFYTKEEIREQLQSSLNKTLKALSQMGVNINEPISHPTGNF